MGCEGPTHFAFELNLLAQVDELLCPSHPLDVVIAVPDQLRVEQGEEREKSAVLEAVTLESPPRNLEVGCDCLCFFPAGWEGMTAAAD